MQLLNLVKTLALAASLVTAHPGEEEHPAHHAARPIHRSLANCREAFAERDFVRKSINRRVAQFEDLRSKRGIEVKKKIRRRDFDEVLRTVHLVDEDYDENTPAAVLFGGSAECNLDPLVTEGPLYVRGEEVRRELTDGESGVPLTIDIQVVDVTTCQPVPQAAVDFWSANSTGVYGGVLDYPGNGDPNDLSLINATTLRGVQFTDEEGMATFDTVVPGHYSGRTNHVHAMVHLGAQQLENNTITGGTVAHIGQMYFDQSLLESVEQTFPYADNTQAWMKNADDFLMRMGAANDDPVVYYVMLGDTIEDGIFGWIRFGVDVTANHPYYPAAYKDENGGHMVPGGGGPPFPGGPPGGFPGFPPPPN